jgi:hypothetical protein
MYQIENTKSYTAYWVSKSLKDCCLLVKLPTISWQSVLLVEVTGENHQPVVSNWQTLSHNVVRVHLAMNEYTLPWTGFELTTLVVIDTDCII